MSRTPQGLRFKNWIVVLALIAFAAVIYFVTVVRVGEGERVRAAETTLETRPQDGL